MIGWLLAIALCLWVGNAEAGLNTSCLQGNGTQPSPASSQGFNCLRIYENWRTAATIDASDTRNAGYTWYTHNASTQGPNGTTDNGWNFGNIQKTPTTDWSWTTPGQITLGPAVNATIYDALPIMFSSCAQVGTTQQLVGTTYGPSFYVDVSMDTISTGNVSGIDVIAWGVPTVMMIGGAGTTQDVFEPDIFEGAFGFFIHDWHVVGASSSSNVFFLDASASLATPTILGLRAVPAALNGGTTSLIDRYTNDSLNPSGSCTVTASGAAVCDGLTSTTHPSNPSGTYSDLNNMQYCLALSGGGAGNPGVFKEIQVWTR